MSQRAGKAHVSEGLVIDEKSRRVVKNLKHGEFKHVHLTNNIHIKRHLHLLLQSAHSGLMVDGQRTPLPQLPHMRELTALRKARPLKDPGTSSSVSSDGRSAGGSKKAKLKTFIGDPHQDAQALAVELSGKLAKSAKIPFQDNGGRQRKIQADKSVNIDKQPKRSVSKKMASKEASSPGSDGKAVVRNPVSVDVRERIKQIEQAFSGSTSGTYSGELRKEELLKELKNRERLSREAEKELENITRSDERWESGPARREEIARRVIDERGSSMSSLSQLLGNHIGSSRSGFNFLSTLGDEERRSDRGGESAFETDADDANLVKRETTRPKPATLNPASPIHLGSASRGKEDLKKPKPGITRGRRKLRPRERNAYLTRVRTGKAAAGSKNGVPPRDAVVIDDELDVSELPPQTEFTVSWDSSRIHKHGDRAYIDVTDLARAVSESRRRHGSDSLLSGQNPPAEQSISSLDSDVNALPFIIGDEALDSDGAGYYIDTMRPREVPQKQWQRNRRVLLQNAVKDVPVVEAASTSGSKVEAPPDGNRTLTLKYRPKNFKDIVGQPMVVKSLSSAITKRKVAPVYLFMGPRGTGKTSAARVLAAGLNCESPDYSTRPCGLCRECATMVLNRSTDVRQIEAASNVDMASLKAMMGSLKPHARYKVIIVEGCDLLNTDIWNAFLTLLEEPPRDVVFVLITTDAGHIPATATSRCQKFHFSKVSEADIVRRLEYLAEKEGLHVEAGALSLIAARSDGSLRDAVIHLDQVCLLDKNVSVDLVREVGGLPPVNKNLDLLDYALSADTINTVKTLREVLASSVEPLGLVSQLGSLITDILAGSLEVDRGSRKDGSFFNRNFSAKEEQHRLRQALKVLSEAEMQLRVASDKATWLTAALLQFAPDWSFLPSEANTDVALTSARPSTSLPVSKTDHLSMNEPEYQAQVTEPIMTAQTPQAYTRGQKKSSAKVPEEDGGMSWSEQKLEEAWARGPAQQQVAMDKLVGETSEPLRRASETTLGFQIFRDDELVELWRAVLWNITSRNLRQLLQTHGQLVAGGVASDGSLAFVSLEFDHPRDKYKAERSWKTISATFQAVLGTVVELQISLNDNPLDNAALARAGEPTANAQPGPSTHHEDSEIVTEDSNAEQPGPSTQQQHKKKGIVDEDSIAHAAHLQDTQGAHSPSHQRRATKTRRHRQVSSTTEGLEIQPDIQQQSEPEGLTPRRLPPSRRRRVRRSGAAKAASSKGTKTAIPVREIRVGSKDSSSFDSIGGGRRPQKDKEPLSTMFEDRLGAIEDLHPARRNSSQEQNDSEMPPRPDRRNSTVDAQRGLPRESSLCCRRASSQPGVLMRKSRVKSLHKAKGKTLFLRLVPCAKSRVAGNPTPAPVAP